MGVILLLPTFFGGGDFMSRRQKGRSFAFFCLYVCVCVCVLCRWVFFFHAILRAALFCSLLLVSVFLVCFFPFLSLSSYVPSSVSPSNLSLFGPCIVLLGIFTSVLAISYKFHINCVEAS